MTAGCGSCNLCCKLLGVPDINKPSGMLCWWTTQHGGCVRHKEKPKAENVRYDEETKTFSLANNDPGDLSLAACAQFRCLWLDSQSQKDPELRQGRLMRPDVTHVVMGPQDVNDETLLYIQVDPSHPGAWRQEPVAGYLNDIISRGGKIEIMMGDISFRLDEMFQ